MTEKRFENRLNNDNIKFNTLNPVWDNEKETALNVFGMIDLLNELNDESMDLRAENTKFKLVVGEIIEDMQKYVDDDQLVYINQSYVDWIRKELDLTLYSKKEDLE